jgi:ribosome-associated translation inhibitor RaiA
MISTVLTPTKIGLAPDKVVAVAMERGYALDKAGAGRLKRQLARYKARVADQHRTMQIHGVT